MSTITIVHVAASPPTHVEYRFGYRNRINFVSLQASTQLTGFIATLVSHFEIATQEDYIYPEIVCADQGLG